MPSHSFFVLLLCSYGLLFSIVSQASFSITFTSIPYDPFFTFVAYNAGTIKVINQTHVFELIPNSLPVQIIRSEAHPCPSSIQHVHADVAKPSRLLFVCNSSLWIEDQWIFTQHWSTLNLTSPLVSASILNSTIAILFQSGEIFFTPSFSQSLFPLYFNRTIPGTPTSRDCSFPTAIALDPFTHELFIQCTLDATAIISIQVMGNLTTMRILRASLPSYNRNLPWIPGFLWVDPIHHFLYVRDAITSPYIVSFVLVSFNLTSFDGTYLWSSTSRIGLPLAAARSQGSIYSFVLNNTAVIEWSPYASTLLSIDARPGALQRFTTLFSGTSDATSSSFLPLIAVNEDHPESISVYAFSSNATVFNLMTLAVPPCLPGSYFYPVCQACPRGYYCPSSITGEVVSSPLLCESGSFCNETQMSVPFTCPSHRFCPQGSIDPSIPKPGEFVDGVAQSGAEACPDGYACAGGDADPQKCQAGETCMNAASMPIPCAVRFICPNPDLLPQLCEPSFFCPLSGMAQAFPCPAGYSCATNGTIQPQICSFNHYCPPQTANPIPCTPDVLAQCDVLGLSSSPLPIAPPVTSSSSLQYTNILISGLITGALSVGFLLLRLLFMHLAQRRLQEAFELDEKQSVSQDHVQYLESSVKPIVKQVLKICPTTGFLGYRSLSNTQQYIVSIKATIGKIQSYGFNTDLAEIKNIADREARLNTIVAAFEEYLGYRARCCSWSRVKSIFVASASIEKFKNSSEMIAKYVLKHELKEDHIPMQLHYNPLLYNTV